MDTRLWALMSIRSYPLRSGCGVSFEPSNHSKRDREWCTPSSRLFRAWQGRCRACDSRVYEYLLPSYCLLPPSSSDALSKQLDESSPGWREALEPGASFADEGIPAVEEETRNEDVEVDPRLRGEYERRRGWRVDKPTMERFRTLIQMFKGTKWVFEIGYRELCCHQISEDGILMGSWTETFTITPLGSLIMIRQLNDSWSVSRLEIQWCMVR